MNCNQNNEKKLQYNFLLDPSGNIYPAGESEEKFLSGINYDDFLSHCQCLKVNELGVTSTVIIANDTYCMHIVPITPSIIGLPKKYFFLTSFSLIVLHNQPLLSELIHFTTKSHDISSSTELLNTYSDGLFFTRSDAKILYINKAYQQLTGLSLDEINSKSLYELNAQGLLVPILLPHILETNCEYVVLQRSNIEVFSIVYGLPIYNSSGETIMVLCCVTPLSQPFLDSISKSLSHENDFTQQLNLHKAKGSPHHEINLIAESPEMRKLIQDITKAAHYDVPILLLGESGTGKEILSDVIHSTSRRRAHPFVKVNCSAISPSLLDAELFGYEPNAFTGASQKGHKGFFETANNGTIMLDEIGDMPLDAQAKILRTLQTGEIIRVGSATPIKVNVRIIAATNKDLRQMVKDGSFRMDLFYRLNVISFHLPSLKERRKDIKPLLHHYTYILNKKYHLQKNLSPELLDLLSEYDWPGNIRELRNLLERMMIICVDNTLDVQDFYNIWDEDLSLNDTQTPQINIDGIMKLNDAVAITESTLVERAMKKSKNTRDAAELLGISQSTMVRKLKQYGIEN